MEAMALMTVNNDLVVFDGKGKNPTAITNRTDVRAFKLIKLEEKRKKWETTAFRTSNQQLYAVLADCLAYGESLPIAEARQRTKDLEEFFKLRGYTVKSGSPLLTRVVKAVFGNVDRRRISTYSLVLRTAQREGVTADKLAGWIEERGGVQEVKLSRSATYVSPNAKAAKAIEQFDMLPELAYVKSEALSQLADADFLGQYCLLIAEQNAGGAFVVRALTRASGAVNAVFAALYAEQKKAA